MRSFIFACLHCCAGARSASSTSGALLKSRILRDFVHAWDAMPTDGLVTICDVGANNGEWSQTWLAVTASRPRTAPLHLHLFEPQPFHRAKLEAIEQRAKSTANLHATFVDVCLAALKVNPPSNDPSRAQLQQGYCRTGTTRSAAQARIDCGSRAGLRTWERRGCSGWVI